MAVRLLHFLWGRALRFAPTCTLQDAMVGREGVKAQFVPSGKTVSITETGVCWLTVNYD